MEERKVKTDDENTLNKVEELKNDLRKAQRELRSATDKSIKEMLRDMISDLKLDLGWTLFDCGKFEEGLELYESVPWTSWGESKCNGLSRALTETGHYDEAKRLLRKGLREFPDSYLLWTALGVLHDRRGSYSKALKCFEKAIRVSPEEDPVLFHNKVVVLDNLGLQDDAVSFLDDLLKKYPQEPMFFVDRGQYALDMGYPEDALFYFQDAMNLIDGLPNNHARVCVYIGLSSTYLELGMEEEAREVLKAGLKEFPEDERLKELLEDLDKDMDDPDSGGSVVFTVLSLVALIRRKLRRPQRL